ncbi:unnamed protein product [Moneuplotes crassus]|uniref:RBR-type E3 ubiquitin transferase n=1 Tax=Euplotes crassus TaxID=5936 RepID=A0AAD1U6D3_EUPCR|nr:unnamed protein product [Moneuplotes crassus]
MSETLCPVCYCNNLNDNSKLHCGFEVCEECVVNWVKTEAKYDFITAGDPTRSVSDAISKQEGKNYSTIIETIKCININCQNGEDEEAEEKDIGILHRLTYEECLDFVQKSPDQKYRDLFSNAMLDLLVPNSRSSIKCPKQGCEYVGYVNLRDKCNAEISCELCGYSWREPGLTPFSSKLFNCLCSWKSNLNLFTELQKVIRAQACPGCGISIIKGPGCKHMVCQKCEKEFCWICLGDYPGYRHRGVLFCPFRLILKILIWLWLILFTVNLKFIIIFPAYRRFTEDAIKWIGIWLLANIMMISLGLALIWYQIAKDSFEYRGGCNTVMYYFLRLLSLIWPLLWCAMWASTYIFWDLGKSMLWILLWQTVALIGLAIIAFLVFIISKCIKQKLYVRRQRIMYEQIQAANASNAGYGDSLVDNQYYDENVLGVRQEFIKSEPPNQDSLTQKSFKRCKRTNSFEAWEANVHADQRLEEEPQYNNDLLRLLGNNLPNDSSNPLLEIDAIKPRANKRRNSIQGIYTFNWEKDNKENNKEPEERKSLLSVSDSGDNEYSIPVAPLNERPPSSIPDIHQIPPKEIYSDEDISF